MNGVLPCGCGEHRRRSVFGSNLRTQQPRGKARIAIVQYDPDLDTFKVTDYLPLLTAQAVIRRL